MSSLQLGSGSDRISSQPAVFEREVQQKAEGNLIDKIQKKVMSAFPENPASVGGKLADSSKLAGGSVVSTLAAIPAVQILIGGGRLGVELANYILSSKKFPEAPPKLSEMAVKTATLSEFSASLGNIFMGKTGQTANVESPDASSVKFSQMIPVYGAALDKISGGVNRVTVALGDETSTGGKLKGRGQYDTIDHSFVGSDGKIYGGEKITRLPVIDERKASLAAKKEFLQKKLALCDPDDRAFIKRQISKAGDELTAAIGSGHSTWIGSNLSRDVLVGNGIKEDRGNIIPGAVNLREQKVEIADQEPVSMLRYGAIWDPRNGLLNLKDLKALAQGAEEAKNNPQKGLELTQKINNKCSELDALAKKAKTPDQKTIINEAKEHLQAFLPNAGNVDAAKRKEIIDDRTKFLRDQTLEPIKAQLKNNHAKMITVDGKQVLRMTHVGLLNGNAPVDLQPSGWAHVEAEQIKDMQATFESIDSLEIKVHNGVGTFFDETKNGTAVMYVSAAEIGWNGTIPSDIKLETCFVNVSVQGTTTNEGMQAEINKAGIEKLESWVKSDPKTNSDLKQELTQLKERLETAHESSFDLAADIAIFANALSATSQGCLSCKDRGGTVAEMISIKLMDRHWSNQLRGDAEATKKLQKAIKKFGNQILDKDSPCVKVVNDCTGVSIAKVDYFQLSSMDLSIRVKKCAELGLAFATGGLNVNPEENEKSR